MAVKRLTVEGVGEVALYKRRDIKSIRLSIRPDGTIRVTLPSYVPYQAALHFLDSKRDWLLKHAQTLQAPLENAQQIGKLHRLRFISSFEASKVRSSIINLEIQVIHPAIISSDDRSVQAIAQRACVRALRSEAEELLPARVRRLAETTHFTYNSVVIKKLKGRWGSCDQDNNIVLNLFLMQLPWELIDYVILHELVHTQQLHHGPGFWSLFEAHQPAAKSLQKQIRRYQPNLILPPIQ